MRSRPDLPGRIFYFRISSRASFVAYDLSILTAVHIALHLRLVGAVRLL